MHEGSGFMISVNLPLSHYLPDDCVMTSLDLVFLFGGENGSILLLVFLEGNLFLSD